MLSGSANAFTNLITVPPGWSLIANPLFHSRSATLADAVPDNSVAELLKRVPHGTQLLKFDNATGRYSHNHFLRGRWTNPRQTLAPGEGAFIFNPNRKPFTVAFSGNCAYGGAVNLPAGLSLISAPDCGGINFAPLIWPPPGGWWFEWYDVITEDGTNYTLGPVVRRESTPCPPVPPQGWDSMAFNPQEGDVIYTYDPATDRFRSHAFRNGAWDRVPVLGLGQACLVHTMYPRAIRYTGPMPL